MRFKSQKQLQKFSKTPAPNFQKSEQKSIKKNTKERYQGRHEWY